jgi:cytochrome c oxidase subunit 2
MTLRCRQPDSVHGRSLHAAGAGAAACALLLAGCSGDQSVTNPKSPDAELVADLWWGMLIIGTVILAAVVVLLLVGLARGRGAGRERPLSPTGRWALVLAGGVAAPVVAILGLVVSGVLIGSSTTARSPVADVTIEVTGRRWWWEIRYRDGDGRHIATTANEIHLPVDGAAHVRLRSDNVIHSFWVPNLQGKTDMIPGRDNESWLRPAQVGVFRGQCAEFCGIQHAFMGFLLVVEPAEDFRDWLERQADPAVTVTDPAALRGREVFLSAGCAACHTVRGTPARGELGPDLTHIASRRTLAAATIPNTRGHLAGWIADPQHVKPGALMPPTMLAPDDLQALLAYLERLE